MQNDHDLSYRIRPAGRHILTIGRELIQDRYSAIIELVKNAYDADSLDVTIAFLKSPNNIGYQLRIEDHGHGMSRQTVIEKWLVPSTDDKLGRKLSPAGRVMQGRKGVGRYAASLLGENLLLETTSDGRQTVVFVEWSSIATTEYLDQVEVLVETSNTSRGNGTTLTISSTIDYWVEWPDAELSKLEFELSKLMSPLDSLASSNGSDANEFSIRLKWDEALRKTSDLESEVKPFPIVQLYDYRISGFIEATGAGHLEFHNQRPRDSAVETIPFDIGAPTGCGKLEFDVRAYDRDGEALDHLVSRGLKNRHGEYMGRLEARQLLNISNGIGVYRNGFRIRPLGDPDFDWLKLDYQRVQNPSLRVGNNQVIGFVKIQSEEESGLVEKSARDGMRENIAFQRLKELTKQVVQRLEERRFTYRSKTGASRSIVRTEKALERLVNFDELKQQVRLTLNRNGVDEVTTTSVEQLLDKKESEGNQAAEELRQVIAFYQGQATLGKIIRVILHEGRKPLAFFQNRIPDLFTHIERFTKLRSESDIVTINKIGQGAVTNSEMLLRLFKRLDPFSTARRVRRKVNLKKEVSAAFEIFEEEFRRQDIQHRIEGEQNVFLECWRDDIYYIFTNLIENSIYWMSIKPRKEKWVSVNICAAGGVVEYIDYRDNGPGIELALIESGIIFEPEFSTKPDGTGLGLAIAGEAASRNGFQLSALESSLGAYFRLTRRVDNNQ